MPERSSAETAVLKNAKPKDMIKDTIPGDSVSEEFIQEKAVEKGVSEALTVGESVEESASEALTMEESVEESASEAITVEEGASETLTVGEAMEEGTSEEFTQEEVVEEAVPEELILEETISEETVLEEVVPEEAVGEEVTEEEAAPEDESSLPFASLSQIGINVPLGLDYCCGEEGFYLEMLRMFSQQSEGKRDEIVALYGAENWTDYAVKVHALKSTSLTIGAEKLSAQAKALELAGKQGDVDYIREHHPGLLSGYEELCARIAGL